MKFTFRAPERSHGIRVIDGIPDHDLCRVEGLNGVGKTLALHLLELCTGQQPYRTRPNAWRTLCQYLGPAEVVVEGLKQERDGGDTADGRHELRFAFDWRGRADEAVPLEVTADLFDAITLDGDPLASMTEVREWLAVVRIAGDETLIETITALVAHDRERLRVASRVAQARRDYADRELEAMLSAFPAEPAQRAVEIAADLRGLVARLREIDESLAMQAEAVERLQAAEEAHAAVSDVRANAGTLRSEIEDLKKQYEEAHTRTKETEARLAEARERERLSGDASRKLASAQRTFTLRLNKLKNADDAIEQAAAGLGIEPDASSVKAAREDVASERSRIAQARADMQDVFALRDLLDGLVKALAPAAAGGLRQRTIAVMGGQTIMAGDLLDSVRQRRDRLMEESPGVEELDQQLARLDARDAALADVEKMLADRDSKRDSVAEAQSALEDLAEAGESPAESVAERAAAHAGAQRVEIEIAAALGAAERQLRQLGGGISLEDLNAQLERRLVEAGVTKATLHDELQTARVRLAAIQDARDTTASRRDELNAAGEAARQVLREQARALQVDERHARLRAILGDRAPDPARDAEELGRAWIAVHDAEERAVRRLQQARTGLEALVAAMNDLVSKIRDGDRPGPELDVIRKYYEARLLEQFDQPELLKALFDGGELTRVDLAGREVRWKTQTGEPRVRPFEAFSSGERAFAYVQARLATARDLTSLNRVVAIDEFGAFLSTDRLMRLREAVGRQLDAGVVDQAIVVLPLRTGTVEADDAAPPSADREAAADYVTGRFDPLAAV